MQRRDRFLAALAVVFAVEWLVLAIEPLDRKDWALENALVVVAIAVLVLTYR